MSPSPLRIAIIGAGNRGRGFADLIKEFSHLGVVSAVAEPRAAQREALARDFNLAPEGVFDSWEAFAAHPDPAALADAAVIATMDRDHAGPAVACLDRGLHLLLEKPMATTLEDCQAIAAAQARSGALVAVCHSLRYHKAFARLKEIVDSGRIGCLISIEHTEQVGFYHYPHSFVRGNWGNEERSTFMLLAKSCHDIDYLSFLAAQPCRRVSSFGSLTHFTRANAPAGSTDRCTDGCAVEFECPYSAIRQYVQNSEGWAALIGIDNSPQARRRAIEEGPFGRCVYRADNNVVDHQVVLLEYEGGVTATFTMIAFAPGGRRTRLYGTRAQVEFDETSIRIEDLVDHNVETIAIAPENGGHGGGDGRVLYDWLTAIQRHDPSLIRSGAQASLASHTIVFAAELARREGRTVELAELEAATVQA